jgi:hypothetical protein
MQTYVAARYPPGYEYEISALFSGALIFLAVFVSFFLAWKAIEWIRNRRRLDPDAVEAGPPTEVADPWEKAISRPSTDHYYGEELGGLGSMNAREQEELFSTYAPRNVRKAMRQRRKAREQAQKHQNK